jgi:ATP-dependent RNA helicase DeaD
MTNFTDFGLSAPLIESLEKMKITTPTSIQAATIPPALSGMDILASAQTGSGKTVAYLIPLIVNLLANSKNSALVLTPTRELAMQVHQTLNQLFTKHSPFKMAVLIGGMPISKQIAELKNSCRLIIGTPGRIIDHLERGSLLLNKTHFLVIDEVDRMLDMGFGIQLERIAKYLPETRQTLMFSATMPPNIEKLAKKYLKDPQRISIGSSTQPALKIKQETLHTTTSDKFSLLLKQLDQREGAIIVFVKTKHNAKRLSKELNQLGYSTNAIHGDLTQGKRALVIKEFRHQKSRIMIATDIAARGLDIPHVMHVINYNLPECPEDYIHRIGRTGRAGQEGNALCLISPEDSYKWKAIARMMGHPIQNDPVDSPPQVNQNRKKFMSQKGHFRNSNSRHGKYQKRRGLNQKP